MYLQAFSDSFAVSPKAKNIDYEWQILSGEVSHLLLSASIRKKKMANGAPALGEIVVVVDVFVKKSNRLVLEVGDALGVDVNIG